MGIIATLKIVAPLTLYTLGLVGMLTAITGKSRWALALVILLLPLRNVVEKIQEFPAGTQFIDMLFASMLVGWVISTTSSSRKFMEKTYINAPAILMVVYLFFSLLIGTHSLTGGWGLDRGEERVQDWKNFTLLPILFLITVNNLPDKKWVWRIFLVMTGAMVLVNYYTVTQISEYSSLISRDKISGTFQFLGPNEVAAFLNQNTIVLTGVYFFLKRSWAKFALLALILVNSYCIIFLYSRGAYLGLCAGLFILFLVKNQKMLIPLILVLVFWQVVLPQKAIDRIKGTTNEYGELDESSELRLVMWEKGMELFKGSPLVGIGYGVFRMMDFGTGLHDTHNIYVKILVEQGVIGILLFLFVIFSFMRQGFFLYQKGDDAISRGLGLGVLASMFTLLINNFFGDRWSYFELSAYVWAFGGLVARLSTLKSEEQNLEPQIAETDVGFKIKTTQVRLRKTRKSYYK
jgi:O-antigen ligase